MVAKKISNIHLGASGGSHNNVSEDWTRFGKKQILSIGKKRQRIHEDDELVDEVVDSSSDEEEGRTSAVKEKTKKVRPPPPPVATTAAGAKNEDASPDAVEPTPSKKKKKGKKERAKEAEAKLAVEGATGDARNENDTTTEINDDSKNDNATKTKGKRKKVRSRQKNIRKDNRATDKKPSHLVVGGDDYGGRSMTKETREKLGLETKAKKPKRSSAGTAFDRGDWVGGAKSDTKNTDDVAVESVVCKETEPKMEEGGNSSLTKIGDCIVDTNAVAQPDNTNKQDVGENIISENKDKKKMKKQKKRKFKNLVVG